MNQYAPEHPTQGRQAPFSMALENRIPPPLVALAIGGAMWGVARVSPAVPIPPAWSLTLRIIVAVASVTFATAAFRTFRRARTTVSPINIDRASRLVTGGIYRVTRNPMYVGLSGLLTAWALNLNAAWSYAGPVLFVLFTQRFQIIPEERAMEAKFGTEYLDYKRKVRRWL